MIVLSHFILVIIVAVHGAKNCAKFEDLFPGHGRKSLAYFPPNGRLGNAIFSYAVLRSLALKYEIRTFLDPEPHEDLHGLFANISLGSWSQELCDFPENWPVQSIIQPFNQWKDDHFEDRIWHLWPLGLQFGPRGIMTPILEEFMPTIRKDLTIRKEITSRSNKIFQAFSNKDISSGNLIFVGVHVRRTDHLGFEAKMGQRPLSRNYFLEAMHLYSQQWPSTRIMFLIMTDDPQWAEINLNPKIISCYQTGPCKILPKKKAKKNVYMIRWEGLDPEEIKRLDFSTLATSNHTILSRGTFGFWASRLGMGMKVVPYHFERDKTTKEQNFKDRKTILSLNSQITMRWYFD